MSIAFLSSFHWAVHLQEEEVSFSLYFYILLTSSSSVYFNIQNKKHETEKERERDEGGLNRRAVVVTHTRALAAPAQRPGGGPSAR